MPTHEVIVDSVQVFLPLPKTKKIGSLSFSAKVTVLRIVNDQYIIANEHFPREEATELAINEKSALSPIDSGGGNGGGTPPAEFPLQRIWVEDEAGNMFPYMPDTETGVRNVSNLTPPAME